MLKPTWMNSLLGSALALALFATPAIAAEFGEWDKNTDAGIDEQEYRAGLEGAGVFNEWDANDDRMLTEDEFTAGVGENRERFNERFGENAYAEWDADDDNMLSEDEFYGGTYGAYDANQNNVIEEPEFGDLGDDLGDGGFWDV